jgi:hypothetical protein
VAVISLKSAQTTPKKGIVLEKSAQILPSEAGNRHSKPQDSLLEARNPEYWKSKICVLMFKRNAFGGPRRRGGR